MIAIMLLPRQFQVMVIENVDERHLKKATSLFRFTCCDQRLRAADRPRRAAALSGLQRRRRHLRAVAADGSPGAASPARVIGGLSAAYGMVIVETIALLTMACTTLVMPVLLRLSSSFLASNQRRELVIGRCSPAYAVRAIVLILLLGDPAGSSSPGEF